MELFEEKLPLKQKNSHNLLKCFDRFMQSRYEFEQLAFHIHIGHIQPKPIVLSSEFVNTWKTNLPDIDLPYDKTILKLQLNSNIIVEIDIDKFPQALQGNKFFPFRRSSPGFDITELPLKYCRMDVCCNKSKQTMRIQTLNESTNDLQCFVVEHWDGSFNIMVMKEGTMFARAQRNFHFDVTGYVEWKMQNSDIGSVTLTDDLVKSLNSSTLTLNLATLEFQANGVALSIVDVKKYPNSLIGNRFFPFKRTTSDLQWNHLPLMFSHLHVKHNSGTIEVPTSNECSDQLISYVVEQWDGLHKLIIVREGLIVWQFVDV